MKQEDFNRLKSVCEKEGFEIEIQSIEGYDQDFTFVAKKRDIWEGVEFFNTPKGIFPLRKVLPDRIVSTQKIFYDSDYRQFKIEKCKPSTESAYFEQLKAEAFERFGEIKVGDRFTSLRETVRINTIDNGDGFRYFGGEDDLFAFNGWVIYKSGKWAEKVKERIDVKWDGGNVKDKSFYFLYDQETEQQMINRGLSKIGEFLASQLEKYLNDEI